MMSLESIIKIIRKVIRNVKKAHSGSSSTQLYKADTAFYNTVPPRKLGFSHTVDCLHKYNTTILIFDLSPFWIGHFFL